MSEPPTPGRYEYLDFNAPLSSARADSIAQALAVSMPETILDVGCGWGELLLRTLAAAPAAYGRGVDTDGRLISRAISNARARGLDGRVLFLEAPAELEHEQADVVICIGADHAFGSQSDALSRLYTLTCPGGRLLFGTGYWGIPPTPEQAAALGMTKESIHDLAGLVDMTIAEGFRPLHIQTANRDEWEEFESGYLADSEEWLLRCGTHPNAESVRARSDIHRNAWLRQYSEVLGFAYLTLGRSRPQVLESETSGENRRNVG